MIDKGPPGGTIPAPKPMNKRELQAEMEHWRRVAKDAEKALSRELKVYAQCLLEAREESSRLRLEIAALEIQLNKPQ